MEKKAWKRIAIIFLILFLLTFFAFGYSEQKHTENAAKEKYCSFEVCKDYPLGIYSYGTCSCYDYDLLGDLIVAKIEVMD